MTEPLFRETGHVVTVEVDEGPAVFRLVECGANLR
jgi:hypothetical protein